MTPLILAFPHMHALGQHLATSTGAQVQVPDLHHFPDGETLVTLPADLAGRDVAILCSLANPDPLALPLRFCAATARELGARRVGLVAPYLAYMRQDARFAPGQTVSAPVFAKFLEETVDWIVTVDPHLHRIASLDQLFTIPARNVAAAPAIAAWISTNVPDAVLLGPDGESAQWVGEVARLANRPYEVLHKTRRGDFDVEITLPENSALRQGTPVVLDDIVSSGRTMAQAVRHLVAAGTRPPICVVTHAIFAGDAQEFILKAGAGRIVSTDTIAHPTNGISVAGQIGAVLVDLFQDQA